MKHARRLGVTLVVVLAVVNGVVAFQARALPRYTARYEQKCALCHVNPSGGGLRTAYASQQLAPQEIAWSKGKPELLEAIEPMIAKSILIGTDFRELYLGSDIDAQRNFFQMQSDLYFDFQLDPKMSLYYDRGISNSYELFGVGYVLPVVYVKAGRFVPSYGWKFDDHTMYVRSEMGFSPPLNSDVGIEIGASPGHLDVQAGVVNGNRGSILDDDGDVSAVLNTAYRFRVGPFGASLGASGSHDAAQDIGGIYGYLTFQRLTWLGEADFFRREGASTTDGLVTSHELSYLLHQGFELKATFDFFDPDRDRASGAKSRWGGGVAVMPRSYLVVDALMRNTTYDDGVAYFGRDFNETLLQLHLLY